MKCLCVSISEGFSTRFFQFTWMVPFLMCYTVENELSNTTWYWGKYSHFWCLIQEALTLHGMKSVQDIPQSLILVSIEGALAAIPKEDLLGQIRYNPRCDSPLGIFGNPHLQSSDLVSFHPCTSPVWCTSSLMTLIRMARTWWSHPLSTVSLSCREGFGYLGSITWYCVQ